MGLGLFFFASKKGFFFFFDAFKLCAFFLYLGADPGGLFFFFLFFLSLLKTEAFLLFPKLFFFAVKDSICLLSSIISSLLSIRLSSSRSA